MMLRAFLLVALAVLVSIVSQAAVPVDLMDFSTAGYASTALPLPEVPARLALTPSGGDDTAAIQAACDAMAQMSPNAQGFRGAVLLRPGSYRISGQIHLKVSGVVLRGDKATLIATGNSRRTLIEIHGKDDRVVSTGIQVTDESVPAGARTLTVANTDGLAVGSRVLIRRPSTKAWIDAVGANHFPGPGQYKDQRLDWVPGSRDIEWERSIVAIEPVTHKLTLDAPITTALESKFGGATVHSFSWPGRLRQVGVEGLLCTSEFDTSNPLDEEHAWICVAIDLAEDVWVRQLKARHFVSSCVWVANRARAVTVVDCDSAEPVSELGAWRRVSFYIGGQQVLVQRCTSEDGRRDFVAGHCAAGPIVFLDCHALNAHAASGPFESWASGVLYDRVSIQGAGLALANLGAVTQGAAWTAANCVLWNCSAASRIDIDNPPGAPSRVFIDSAIPSLYIEQLKARSGEKILAALNASALPRDPAKVPMFTAPKTIQTPKIENPLSLVNGYFVVRGRAIFGTSLNSALWKGQLVSGRTQQMGTNPTRWAPGRIGPTLTEDLDALTEQMAAARAPFYYAFPGLWYDRRRDDHAIVLREDAEVAAPFMESPWARTGKGKAWDGLSKYDLTKFNPWYFARLREMADLCSAKGLVFVYQAYDNHNLQEAAAHWAEFAWRQANAIQDLGFPEPPEWEETNQTRHHIADQFYDTTNPLRRPLHDLYLRHILDVLGDSPNVVLTLGYQFAGPLAFQQYFIDTVAAWEKEHGRRVLLQLQTSKAVTDAILADPIRAAHVDVIDLRYWQYLPDGTLFAPDGQAKKAFRELRTEKFGRDAVMPSTPENVYKQVREYRDRFPDKAILAGHAGFGPLPILMAGGSSPVLAEATPSKAGPPHDDLAVLKFVAEQLADLLPQMRPLDGLTENAWCLSNAKRSAMLLYSLSGDTINLSQALPTGASSTALWFNPRNGETTPAILGDGNSIKKPTAEAWLLFLRNK